ncbi:MAG: uL15 family ribosomal protein [Candidatus Pacearchaeota archaeon]
MIKTHKKKKTTKMRGGTTHGRGARKKGKKAGHRGGVGMAGSGKRADHKKTLITKLYGHGYFGKRGVTSKKTEKDKRKRINIEDIEENLGRYLKEGIAKRIDENCYEIDLHDYKILGGNRKIEKPIKTKMIIKASGFSRSALQKIRDSGGDIIIVRSV